MNLHKGIIMRKLETFLPEKEKRTNGGGKPRLRDPNVKFVVAGSMDEREFQIG